MEIKEIDVRQIQIKRMKEEDLEGVMVIERASFPFPWARNMFLQRLKDNRLSCFLVVKMDKQVIGYGGFSTVLDEVHIDNLAIHPYFRRGKIGEKLITALLDLAKSRGIKKVALEVRAGNLPAQNLYGKLGFKVTKRRWQYYRDTREDALAMSLNLLS
ncbi:ribosomal protein S18-alanine N-acetyltransferase [candidate division NPL-UPA2 bacterium]|nr:ribosomal protein S18-alanine N-acetyltransferase [candidate division NPL-UPA2 bacterium]